MENTTEAVVVAQIEAPTQEKLVNLAQVSQAQIVKSFALSTEQKKALRTYAVINTVSLRGDWNDTDKTFDSIADSYTKDSDGRYERDQLRVEITLADDDEPIKSQLQTEDLYAMGLTDLSQLSGRFVKLTKVPVLAGADLPFDIKGKKVKSTSSFTWAKNFKVLSNNALEMILAMS
jgi:prolyl-tRNA synthetase